MPRFTVIVTGGTLRPLQHSLVEPLAAELLERITADLAFIGCTGVHAEARRDERQPARDRAEAPHAARSRPPRRGRRRRRASSAGRISAASRHSRSSTALITGAGRRATPSCERLEAAGLAVDPGCGARRPVRRPTAVPARRMVRESADFTRRPHNRAPVRPRPRRRGRTAARRRHEVAPQGCGRCPSTASSSPTGYPETVVAAVRLRASSLFPGRTASTDGRWHLDGRELQLDLTEPGLGQREPRLLRNTAYRDVERARLVSWRRRSSRRRATRSPSRPRSATSSSPTACGWCTASQRRCRRARRSPSARIPSCASATSRPTISIITPEAATHEVNERGSTLPVRARATAQWDLRRGPRLGDLELDTA